MTVPVIETPRLLLRDLRLEDADDMLAYASDRELAQAGLWQPLTTIEDSRADLQQALDGYARGHYYEWAVVHKGERRMIGRVGLSHYHAGDRRADLGYALNRAYWGQGYASEATRAVVDFGFRVLDLYRIGAVVLPDNAGSIRVLTRLGLRYEGLRRAITWLRGRPEDLHGYSLLRPEWEGT